jgi:hypothetical protein
VTPEIAIAYALNVLDQPTKHLSTELRHLLSGPRRATNVPHRRENIGHWRSTRANRLERGNSS